MLRVLNSNLQGPSSAWIAHGNIHSSWTLIVTKPPLLREAWDHPKPVLPRRELAQGVPGSWVLGMEAGSDWMLGWCCVLFGWFVTQTNALGHRLTAVPACPSSRSRYHSLSLNFQCHATHHESLSFLSFIYFLGWYATYPTTRPGVKLVFSLFPSDDSDLNTMWRHLGNFNTTQFYHGWPHLEATPLLRFCLSPFWHQAA